MKTDRALLENNFIELFAKSFVQLFHRRAMRLNSKLEGIDDSSWRNRTLVVKQKLQYLQKENV